MICDKLVIDLEARDPEAVLVSIYVWMGVYLCRFIDR